MGVVCSLGMGVEQMFGALKSGATGVRRMPEWESYHGLRTMLGAPAVSYDNKVIPRQVRRTMSRMSEMAFLASQQALSQADMRQLDHRRSLIAMGSTCGSPATFEEYFRKFIETKSFTGQLSTSFFKIMNHSVASNVAVGLNYNGPQLAVSSACSTATQSIIAGWELIRSGLYDVVLAGGADELHVTSAAIFDNVQAASTKFNDAPQDAPRPFDIARDGLVVSEGAGIVVLESEEHARKRGVNPLAYIDGGAYYCDGAHMTQPQPEGMLTTMQMALDRAGLKPKDIQYVNAHGTATVLGDVCEAESTRQLFGAQTPVSSIKGHLGHTLAACGSIELIATIEMMRARTMIANRNLLTIDPQIPDMNLLKENTSKEFTRAISNNFAFGGMNTSVIFSASEELLRQ